VHPPAPPTALDLTHWLDRFGRRASRVTPLAGDVSPRLYFRVTLAGGASAVVAWYPPALAERFDTFAETTGLLERIGVRVPRILERDADTRLMLLEDGGDLAVADLPCGSARVEGLYRRALRHAARIAALAPADVPAANPPLAEALLRRELDQTWRSFLDQDLADDAGLRRELEAALDAVCRGLGGLQLAPCHRDLMARNLLVKPIDSTDELFVIDHQDLRLGPPFYDVASLLHDSTRLHQDQIARFEAEVLAGAAHEAYARVCVQRLFKIVGTFHAFAARGHTRHLSLVPASLRAALQKLRTLPEGADVARRLALRWR
jgi:aminoglycoside/choline kinase family phosphotransferase